MKRKTLILVLILSITILWLSFAQAQDPNDPGDPDTLWISSVTMADVYSFGVFHDFAIECSIWTDDTLSGFIIPISFYNSQNRDIICDSVVWDTFITSSNPLLLCPPVSNPSDPVCIHNDSVEAIDYTPKVFSGKGFWYLDSLDATKPEKRRLFTAWLHAFGNFDTSKSIVLDSVIFHPPSEELICIL